MLLLDFSIVSSKVCIVSACASKSLQSFVSSAACSLCKCSSLLSVVVLAYLLAIAAIMTAIEPERLEIIILLAMRGSTMLVIERKWNIYCSGILWWQFWWCRKEEWRKKVRGGVDIHVWVRARTP